MVTVKQETGPTGRAQITVATDDCGVRLVTHPNGWMNVVLIRHGVERVTVVTNEPTLAKNQFARYAQRVREYDMAQYDAEAHQESFECHVCRATIDWPGCCSKECYQAWKGTYEQEAF